MRSNPQLIGEPPGVPVWAPDGASIAWGSEDGLFRSDLNGLEPVVLASGAVVGRPAWAPEGDALAYIDRSSASLVVVDAKSGAVEVSVPVMTEKADADPLALPVFGGPDWSPDGSRLAFNCWDGTGDEICVTRADGTGYRQVTRIEPPAGASSSASGSMATAASNTGPPSWSPDGVSLAVAAYPERRGAAAGVFVVNLEEGTARRVSSLLPNSEITWFTDGEAVLFSATEKGRSDAVRASTLRDSVEKLTAALPDGAREPALSGDGSKLAVTSGGSIAVLDLQREESANVLAAVPAGLHGRHPAWSPATNALAYSAAPDPIASYS